MTENVSCCLKVVPLRGKGIFVPSSSNKKLALFKGIFLQFPTSTAVLFIWNFPTGIAFLTTFVLKLSVMEFFQLK